MNDRNRHREAIARARSILGRALGAILSAGACVAVSSCYLDELTAPPADESAIEFTVAGDSVLLLGDSLQLSASFDGGEGAGVTRITWISEDTTVARVDELSGIVRGVGAGTTRVSAYLVAPDLDNDLLRTLPIDVQYAGIGMENDSLTGLGESRTLEARGLDVQGGMHEVVPAVFWTTDDSVIALDSTGIAVARHNGTATVNARWGEFTTQAPIRVRQVAGRIVFYVPELRFPVLQSDTTLSVEVRDTQDSLIVSPQVAWSSSNPAGISSTPEGVLRALQRTSATISVTSDTASATLQASVAQVVTSLSINDGNDQSAQVDTPVAIAPSVLARDANGNPVEGALVTFSIAGGAGRVVAASRLTGPNGVARVGSWVLGQTVGLNTLRATADAATVSFQATGTPGSASPTTSTMTATPDTIAAGTNANLTLQAKDVFGNVVTTGGATVVFTSSGGTSTGSISATADNGNGTYTATFTGETAGSATTITANIGGVPIAATLPTVTVTAGSAAQMNRNAGDGQTAGVGSPVFVKPSVLLQDAYGNPVAGVSVTFTATAGGGSVAGSPAVSDANGIATLGSWTLGGTSGANALTASATGVSSVVFNATAVTGAASELTSVITTSVDTVLAGAVSTLTLQTKDAGGNNVTVGGFTVVFTATGGSSTGIVSATTDNGDGTYTATFSGRLAGTATTIGATLNGSAVTTPLPTITVLPGAVSTTASLVTTSVDNLVAGANATLTLDTKDAFGNDITAGGGTVVFSLSGGTSNGVIGVTTDNGDGSYTATLTGQVAGSAVTIGVSIDGAAITSSLPTITVIPGAVSTATSVVTTSLASLAAGSSAALTVTTKDAFGNDLKAGGHTVSFGLTGGSSSGNIGATTDNGDGTYTALLAGQIAGSAVTVTATIDGNAITSTLPTITIVPGPVSSTTSLIGVSTDTIASDNVVTLTLTSKDAFDNALTTGGHAVVFSASGGTSTGTVSATTDNGDGSYAATFSAVLAGTATTIKATIDGQTITSTLPTVTVIPGAPVNIAINAGDGQSALINSPVSVAPSVTVTDTHGNPVSGVAVTFTVTAGAGVVDPTGSVSTGLDGIAAVTSWTLGGSAGTNTLTATAASVPGSVTFTASGLAQAPITLEEVQVANGNLNTLTFPTVAGGSNQTYVLFAISQASGDIDSVMGGGLNWTEQIEQCAGSQDNYTRLWTAQGSPTGSFQPVVFADTTGGSKKLVGVLARYANVSALEGAAGTNNIGGTPCTGPSPFTNPATLSLTSTKPNSVHLIGVGLRTDTVTTVTPGYVEVGSEVGSGDNLYMFVYGKGFSTATTDTFNATISIDARWATAGIVLRPN